MKLTHNPREEEFMSGNMARGYVDELVSSLSDVVPPRSQLTINNITALACMIRTNPYLKLIKGFLAIAYTMGFRDGSAAEGG